MTNEMSAALRTNSAILPAATAANFPATKRGAAKFLNASLRLVESKRIRAWAKTEHNRPVWEREARAWLCHGRRDVTKFATLIVCQAIGL